MYARVAVASVWLCLSMCCSNFILVVTQCTVGLQLLLQVLGIEVGHRWMRSCRHAVGNTLLSSCSCIVTTQVVLFCSCPVAVDLAGLKHTHNAEWAKSHQAS